MLDTIKAFVVSHFTLLFAAWLSTLVASLFVRTLVSARWKAFEVAHPAIGGVLHVLFGMLANADQVRAGVVLIAKAAGWKPPADGAPPSPPSKLPAVVITSAMLLALAGCSSTPGAKSPALDQSAAAVAYGARVVHVADVACAAAGASLRTSGDAAKAAALTGKCSDALRPAADSLEIVATALDAGRAVSDQQIACSVALGVDALVRVRGVLLDLGKPLPASIDTYVRFAAPWLSTAEGLVCS